jgi:ribosome biogenesis protein UTP30
VIHFNKISDKISLKPVRMAIPHPFRNAESEDLSVCIITKDPQRFFKDLINPLELTVVTKIVGISKLRSKFKPFEAKRALCSSFDLFAADTRIIPMLPKIIGKTFFEKKKQPVPVDLSSTSPEDVKQEIQEAVQATYFFQTGGSSTSITVGKCLQDPAHIAANIEAVIKQLGKKLPSGLSTIRTIHVKTKDSAALPIYVRDVKEA